MGVHSTTDKPPAQVPERPHVPDRVADAGKPKEHRTRPGPGHLGRQPVIHSIVPRTVRTVTKTVPKSSSPKAVTTVAPAIKELQLDKIEAAFIAYSNSATKEQFEKNWKGLKSAIIDEINRVCRVSLISPREESPIRNPFDIRQVREKITETYANKDQNIKDCIHDAFLDALAMESGTDLGILSARNGKLTDSDEVQAIITNAANALIEPRTTDDNTGQRLRMRLNEVFDHPEKIGIDGEILNNLKTECLDKYRKLRP